MIRDSHRQPTIFQRFGVLAGGSIMDLTAGDGGHGPGQQAPKRHACHCGKSFLRKEHLRRHQASHGEPAFVCPVCKRSFTRSDLLRRHVALHDTSAVPDFRRGRACDACHSNKTKCDGGPQCSLCAKRRIACTYNRGMASNASDTSSSTNHGNSTEPPPLNPSSSSSSLENHPVVGRDGSSSVSASVQDPFLAASAGPSVSGKHISDAQREAATAGLRIVLKQVTNSRFGQSQSPPMPSPESTPEVKAWLAVCISAYFGAFHERWPLLHAPIFDPATEPAPTIATVAIIGSWLNDDKMTRNLAVEIHNNLVQHLLEDILRITLDTNVRWPIHTYQAALLNIIFAIETGREYLLPKARLLHNLLLTALRGQNIFNSDSIAQQLNTYYPGDFLPWVQTNNEHWKRFAVLTFKVDAYLSLLTNEAPSLRIEELNVGIQSTFALYNAYGLDIFFRRWPCEPFDRAQYKVCDIATSTLQQAPPSMILAEDIQHSLLSMLSDIWTLSQTRRGYGAVSPTSTFLKETISGQLRFCKDQLNRIVGLMANTGIQTQVAGAILGAYSGKEEPGHPSWKDSVRARLTNNLISSTVVYHLVSLHVFSDVQTIRSAFSDPPVSELSGAVLTPLHQQKQAILSEWANSVDGRMAVVHALYCLGVYEMAVSHAEARRLTFDPILHKAVSTSATVVWTWAAYEGQGCHCSRSVLQQIDIDLGELGIPRGMELETWAHNGNPIALQGTPLCRCSIDCWMVRFVSAITRGAQAWDMSNAVVGALSSKLNTV